MPATIGIKVANGDFCSILQEGSTVKKRLILTTVHDSQKSVQIDLYKSLSQTMADALYIGSLVVDKIAPKPKGEPSIELTISSSADGTISAESSDLGNPSQEKQQLSLSLTSFEEDKNDYADFDIEDHAYEKLAPEKDEKPRTFPWAPIIILGVILALICLGLWFFLARGLSLRSLFGEAPRTEAAAPSREAVPPVQQASVSPVTDPPAPEPPQITAAAADPPPAAQIPPSAAQAPARGPPAVAQAPARSPPPAARTASPRKPPVYSHKIPQTIPPEGASYTLRWGDTLWDISEVFYRNPWLYRNIVRFNEVRNPNLIVSGTEIKIPPKN
ncbi:MAG: Hsp70 family protein [Treponema sp.]|jgi:hypothetical protein|nr:Hsp70 family protein [Treponema sp.]